MWRHSASLFLAWVFVAAAATSSPVFDAIPPGVECVATTRCYNWSEPEFGDVCARVCARGSVKQAAWVQRAMQVQTQLSRLQPLCYQQWPGSHNSAISIADGYGVLDHVLTAYLQMVLPGETIR